MLVQHSNYRAFNSIVDHQIFQNAVRSYPNTPVSFNSIVDHLADRGRKVKVGVVEATFNSIVDHLI